MTAANGTAPPQVDARKLASVRKSAATAAKKANEALEACVTAHRGELEAGNVPPGAGLRKLAEKYLQLLGTLDLADQFLTPEALEALAEEDTPEPGTVTVGRNDLALLTEFLRDSGLVPLGLVNEDTPLGRLSEAAGPSFATLAAMVSVQPPGQSFAESAAAAAVATLPPAAGVPVPAAAAVAFAEGEPWYGSDDDDSEPDPGWPSQGT